MSDQRHTPDRLDPDTMLWVEDYLTDIEARGWCDLDRALRYCQEISSLDDDEVQIDDISHEALEYIHIAGGFCVAAIDYMVAGGLRHPSWGPRRTIQSGVDTIIKVKQAIRSSPNWTPPDYDSLAYIAMHVGYVRPDNEVDRDRFAAWLAEKFEIFQVNNGWLDTERDG